MEAIMNRAAIYARLSNADENSTLTNSTAEMASRACEVDEPRRRLGLIPPLRWRRVLGDR